MNRSHLFLLIALWMVSIAGCGTSPISHEKEANRMFTKLTPNLMVPDVNKTVEYYHDVLGFDFIMGVPPDSQEIASKFDAAKPLAFAFVQRDNVQLMLQSQESFVSEISAARGKAVGATATFYVEVSDAQELYNKIQDRATIISRPHGTFYGKEEFSIQDCNGYIFCFAGDLKKKKP